MLSKMDCDERISSRNEDWRDVRHIVFEGGAKADATDVYRKPAVMKRFMINFQCDLLCKLYITSRNRYSTGMLVDG